MLNILERTASNMKELSGLEVRLLDEYYRCERHLEVISRELENGDLKGDIIKMVINGKDR